MRLLQRCITTVRETAQGQGREPDETVLKLAAWTLLVTNVPRSRLSVAEVFVKPLIDADFRTLPGREHTGVVGSSMGGLISLYAFFRRPEVFGLVGAMSPSLWFARRAIFDYIQRAVFVPGRIYLDAGTGEGRGELSDVRRLCRLLRGKGYREGADLLCTIEKGAGHDESAWGHRLPRELRFLLRADGEALAAG